MGVGENFGLGILRGVAFDEGTALSRSTWWSGPGDHTEISTETWSTFAKGPLYMLVEVLFFFPKVMVTT
jgi:hypothetical protein